MFLQSCVHCNVANSELFWLHMYPVHTPYPPAFIPLMLDMQISCNTLSMNRAYARLLFFRQKSAENLAGSNRFFGSVLLFFKATFFYYSFTFRAWFYFVSVSWRQTKWKKEKNRQTGWKPTKYRTFSNNFFVCGKRKKNLNWQLLSFQGNLCGKKRYSARKEKK